MRFYPYRNPYRNLPYPYREACSVERVLSERRFLADGFVGVKAMGGVAIRVRPRSDPAEVFLTFSTERIA
jgi:hypothetical protein